jgi:hypothetical protein
MSISDIITIVGLIIAIVAVINEKSRKHLWLKMQSFDYLIFIVAFLLVNYFVFHEELYKTGLYIESLYFDAWGIEPKYWSYIITMISLLYLWYKIEISFYPNRLSDSVYRFYQNQIENNEIQFLFDLIEKYHKKDIIAYIRKKMDNSDHFLEIYERPSFNIRVKNWFNDKIMKLFPSSRQNREHYAMYVLNGILNDPAFVPLAANLRPYFFADVIGNMTKLRRSNFPSELVKLFLTELLNNKNFWLKKELKESANFDSGQPERYFENNRLVGSLVKDLSVSDVNEVWQPFGEIACNEIAEERTKGFNSKLLLEFQNEETLWEFKTQFSILFLKS